jgi:hypothetical protein
MGKLRQLKDTVKKAQTAYTKQDAKAERAHNRFLAATRALSNEEEKRRLDRLGLILLRGKA